MKKEQAVSMATLTVKTIRRFSKVFLSSLFDIIGFNAICRWVNRNKVLILCYHGVCNNGFDLTDRHLPKTQFRLQVEYLKRKGYRFLSLTELLALRQSGNEVKKGVVLTFDDGLKNVILNAYPIMKEFGAKGCLYLVSDLVGTNELLWTDHLETVIRNQKKGNFRFNFNGKEVVYKLTDKDSYEKAITDLKRRLRTISDEDRHRHLEQFRDIELVDVPEEFAIARWEDIKGLDPDTMEIGSHTRRHPNCANITVEEHLTDEILNAKIEIERHLGREVIHFCYPAGSFDARVVKKVSESGYKSAVTMTYGHNTTETDVFKLKRIATEGDLRIFKSEVSGSYESLRKIKSIFLGGKRRDTM